MSFTWDGCTATALSLGWRVGDGGIVEALAAPMSEIGDCLRRLPAAWRLPALLLLAFAEDCENYVPWQQEQLAPLAAEVDFISLHTYPVWEQKGLDAALRYTEENYQGVAKRYPDKTVVITEAGWATRSNGRGIPVQNANVDFQKRYIDALTWWSRERGILTFLFEAFDEPWKGSADPAEPEKHWGLYTVDRKPKPAAQGGKSE